MLRAWLVPVLLAGLLPVSLETLSRWPVASLWSFPVGGGRNAAEVSALPEPGYATTRGVGGPSGHQGADLSNRREGGEVRAAAAGLVVAAGSRAPDDAYGERVVLAHRLPEGGLVYTVYAHLAAGSIRVKPGEFVTTGARLGKVGRTGDATSPHLHFEVRRVRDPQERWEKAPVVDPLDFLGRRQAFAAADSAGTAR